MENANDKPLSFPQRNWFLLCVIVAILSPLVVDLVRGGARKEAYKQSTEVKASDTATAGAAPGDTSYKVATPPAAADTASRSGAAAAKPAGK